MVTACKSAFISGEFAELTKTKKIVQETWDWLDQNGPNHLTETLKHIGGRSEPGARWIGYSAKSILFEEEDRTVYRRISWW